MDSDRIENNPQYQKLKKDIEGAEALHKITKFCSLCGLKTKGLNDAFSSLPDIKKQLEILSKSPDKFNDYFSNRGWIAHESMNSDLMLSSIESAENGFIDMAEKELIDYYASDKIEWLLPQLNNIDAFKIRDKLLRLAYEDTIVERYYSAVPLLLMMIDGVVNDIDKNKGFFAEKTDLTVWDSIAAHSTGLAKLKEIFSNTRKKTSDEDISLPYRHGILHGRDLGYANKTVAAKCWAALFAIKDWADAVKKGKKYPPPPEPKLTFWESITQLNHTLIEYDKNKKRNELVSKKIEVWKARQLVVGRDIPEKGTSSDYADYTPEQEAIRFAEYWTKSNYGNIAKQLHHFSKEPLNDKNEAGTIRKVFEGKRLTDYKIIKVVDCSPVITEVSLDLSIEYENMQYSKQISLRFIYQGLNNEILVFGDTGGQWRFIDMLFNQIEYL